jgi:hypothetical protein
MAPTYSWSGEEEGVRKITQRQKWQQTTSSVVKIPLVTAGSPWQDFVLDDRDNRPWGLESPVLTSQGVWLWLALRTWPALFRPLGLRVSECAAAWRPFFLFFLLFFFFFKHFYSYMIVVQRALL